MNKFYLLRVIRLIILILTCGFMHLSAAVNAQKVTISVKNVALEHVFEMIKQQTGYMVSGSKSTIQVTRPITIDAVEMPLDEFLEELFRNQPLQFVVGERSIVLSPKEPAVGSELLIPTIHVAMMQQIDIQGVVVDENGLPMEGVTVRVKNSTRTTVTGESGRFSFQDVPEDAVLVFSFLGYLTREIEGSTQMGTIHMQLSSGELEGVEVVYSTGYQTISRERSAGSFSKPDMELLLNRTGTPDILNRLEGLVPGLTHHGPGGLLIRGQSSIPVAIPDTPPLTSTTPLIVIDGIEFDGDIRQLNPLDVEDITVLKDATSASIWGAKAANGVIVITTKKGRASDKLTFNYDGYYAFQGRPDLDYVPRMNSRQFIELSRELFPQYFPFNEVYTRVTQVYGDLPHLQIHYDLARNRITPARADAMLDSLANISNTRQIADLFVRDAATLNQTVSVTGGGAFHTFYTSLNHIGTRNNTPGEEDNQYKINLNNNFQIGSRISASLHADLTNRVTRTGNTFSPARTIVPYQLFEDENGNPLSVNFLGTTPFGGPMPDSLRAIYTSKSQIDLSYNPVLDQDLAYGTGNRFYARLVGTVKANLLKGLDYQGTYGYNVGSASSRNVLAQDAYEMRNLVVRFTEAASPSDIPIYHIPAMGGRLNVSNELTKAWTLRNQLHFDREWSGHQLSAMAGQQATSSTPVNTYAAYYGWDDQLQTSRPVDMAKLTTGVPGAVMGTGILPGLNNVGGGEGRISRTTSYFANAGYTYDRKYTLNASWRIDESNLFGRDKSAQNRPVYSMGAKWALHRENFMQPIQWVDHLDVRLTYGITGNAPFAGTAASYDILTASNNINYVTGAGFLISSPANTKLTWEATTVYNVGFDFALLGNRLSGAVDGYVKKTVDLIGSLSTSPLTGYDNVIGNYGNIDNAGIDIGLSSININRRNFIWQSNLIFNYNKNKLTVLRENAPATGAVLVQATRRVGYPLHTRFAYHNAGLNSEGDPQIRLSDGSVSAALDVATPDDILYMGTTQPVWSGGFINSIQYKAFILSANIIYSGGNVVRRNRLLINNDQILGANTFQLEFFDRWKVPGDEERTDIPRFAPSGAVAGARNLDYYNLSEQFMLDGAYAKLRDITLSYHLPGRVANQLNAQAISFKVQLNNILLWTANDKGMDPEFTGSTRDGQGTLSLGARITF